jgi:hypothetical protein
MTSPQDPPKTQSYLAKGAQKVGHLLGEGVQADMGLDQVLVAGMGPAQVLAVGMG